MTRPLLTGYVGGSGHETSYMHCVEDGATGSLVPRTSHFFINFCAGRSRYEIGKCLLNTLIKFKCELTVGIPFQSGPPVVQYSVSISGSVRSRREERLGDAN